MKYLRPLATLDEQPKPKPKRPSQSKEFAAWVRAVGAARAQQARDIQLQTRTEPGKRTLIELLAEAWLQERGISYRAQVELGVSRPDFVLFHTRQDPEECVAWLINGDYWHNPRTWHDAGKANLITGVQVAGFRVADVVSIWETDILVSPAVFEFALAGERMRN